MSKLPTNKTLTDMIIMLLIILLVIWILSTLFSPTPLPREKVNQIKCLSNMHILMLACVMYADKHEEMYPEPSKWCDLLVDYVPEKFFQCPGGKENKCHYAMNPNCELDSPKDMVLLFESTGGWNQFGGPELLNTQNHEGRGCNVVFNDCNVEFVETEDFQYLQWKDEREPVG
jgi:hypothetical protein